MINPYTLYSCLVRAAFELPTFDAPDAFYQASLPDSILGIASLAPRTTGEPDSADPNRHLFLQGSTPRCLLSTPMNQRVKFKINKTLLLGQRGKVSGRHDTSQAMIDYGYGNRVPQGMTSLAGGTMPVGGIHSIKTLVEMERHQIAYGVPSTWSMQQWIALIFYWMMHGWQALASEFLESGFILLNESPESAGVIPVDPLDRAIGKVVFVNAADQLVVVESLDGAMLETWPLQNCVLPPFPCTAPAPGHQIAETIDATEANTIPENLDRLYPPQQLAVIAAFEDACQSLLQVSEKDWIQSLSTAWEPTLEERAKTRIVESESLNVIKVNLGPVNLDTLEASVSAAEAALNDLGQKMGAAGTEAVKNLGAAFHGLSATVGSLGEDGSGIMLDGILAVGDGLPLAKNAPLTLAQNIPLGLSNSNCDVNHNDNGIDIA